MTFDDLKVILYLVDATIHTALLFGWSSITEILKENGFFWQELPARKMRTNQIQEFYKAF